jgi:hypothetical protein
MLGKKKDALNSAKDKYESGVVKLNETSAMVAELEANLKVSSVEVEKIKKMADAQAQTVGAEKEIAGAHESRKSKCTLIDWEFGERTDHSDHEKLYDCS